MKKTVYLLFLFLSVFVHNVFAQKQYSLLSPDDKIELRINVDKKEISYSVLHQGDEMIAKSSIAMLFPDGSGFGVSPKVTKTEKNR